MAQKAEQNADLQQIDEIVAFLRTKTASTPRVGIICGSGLSSLPELLANQVAVKYEDIPSFPTAHVKGHGNSLVFGDFEGTEVVCMRGRFHFYSGYTMQQVVLGVRVMALLGVTHLIVTNAAGALNAEYNVGDVVIMSDHINIPGMCGQTPLVGVNEDRLGPRFPPMSDVYDPALQNIASDVASRLGHSFIRSGGIYAAVIGPSYETPAESRFLRMIGGDCVGMSTIPEVLAARHAGMRVLGLSLMSNKVVFSSSETPASHQEVLEAVQLRIKQLPEMVRHIVLDMGKIIHKAHLAEGSKTTATLAESKGETGNHPRTLQAGFGS